MASAPHDFTPNKCNCFVNAQLPHKSVVFVCIVVGFFFFFLIAIQVDMIITHRN